MMSIKSISQRRKVAVLISGTGSNMQALVKAAQNPDYPAQIALVLSNKADAKGLVFAQEHGIATAVVSHKDYADRESFEHAIQTELETHGIDMVCLAGFMRVLTPWLISRWEGRMLNIHPSLLPEFKGLHTHKRALEAGVKEHGCTVHYVVPELDAGPIILQARVPVLEDDTEETLAARVLVEEHKIYAEALAKIVDESLRV
jgi:phosphoribosylglycinamide formyltransferase 1